MSEPQPLTGEERDALRAKVSNMIRDGVQCNGIFNYLDGRDCFTFVVDGHWVEVACDECRAIDNHGSRVITFSGNVVAMITIQDD